MRFPEYREGRMRVSSYRTKGEGIMRTSNFAQSLRGASAIALTAAILGFVGLSSPASADEVKSAHFYGPGVLLGNMLAESKSGTTTVPVNAVAKTKTPMYGWVVYTNNGSGKCAVATEGAWTVTTKPTNGTTSTGLLLGPPPSGCTNKLKYNIIFYTSKINKGKDKVGANWKASYQGHNYLEKYNFVISITP
jgi:hypothetical protein